MRHRRLNGLTNGTVAVVNKARGASKPARQGKGGTGRSKQGISGCWGGKLIH
jgi:hypothetical protein